MKSVHREEERLATPLSKVFLLFLALLGSAFALGHLASYFPLPATEQVDVPILAPHHVPTCIGCALPVLARSARLFHDG